MTEVRGFSARIVEVLDVVRKLDDRSPNALVAEFLASFFDKGSISFFPVLLRI